MSKKTTKRQYRNQLIGATIYATDPVTFPDRESPGEYITDAERVLEMWLEQYHIEGDKYRESRPEIQATLELLKKIKTTKLSA